MRKPHSCDSQRSHALLSPLNSKSSGKGFDTGIRVTGLRDIGIRDTRLWIHNGCEVGGDPHGDADEPFWYVLLALIRGPTHITQTDVWCPVGTR